MDYYRGSDAELWKRYKEGDEKAFSTIYSEHSTKLYKYGLKFTSIYSIIEDSIQELFFELIKNRKTIGYTDNVLRYLMKSFRRKLFRQLKKEGRYYLHGQEEEYAFEIQYSVETEFAIEEATSQKAKRLSIGLKKLSPRQKEAIYLKYTAGLDYSEICEIMEMNLESCRNLMYRAIKSLKETVDRKHG